MSKKESNLINGENQEVTQEQLLRMRQARDGLSEGVIASQMPAPRAGYVQYVSTEKRLKKKLDLGYTQRLDEKGKPLYIEDMAGNMMPVVEIPQALWDDSRKYKNTKAQEPVQNIKREKVFGDSGEYFSGGADLSRGTEEFKSNQ